MRAQGGRHGWMECSFLYKLPCPDCWVISEQKRLQEHSREACSPPNITSSSSSPSLWFSSGICTKSACSHKQLTTCSALASYSHSIPICLPTKYVIQETLILRNLSSTPSQLCAPLLTMTRILKFSECYQFILKRSSWGLPGTGISVHFIQIITGKSLVL